jgi:ribonuclease HI
MYGSILQTSIRVPEFNVCYSTEYNQRYKCLSFKNAAQKTPSLNASVNRRLSNSPGKHATVFQSEVYAILACVHEIWSQDRLEKYVSICSDSQAALKALQDAKTTFSLVRHCQQALNDVSTRHAVGLYWVPGRAGVRGNEIADRLARNGSAQRFVGPEHLLGSVGRL